MVFSWDKTLNLVYVYTFFLNIFIVLRKVQINMFTPEMLSLLKSSQNEAQCFIL